MAGEGVLLEVGGMRLSVRVKFGSLTWNVGKTTTNRLNFRWSAVEWVRPSNWMKSNGIKEKIHLFYASEKYYQN
jgi:hypothetical protein